MEVITIESSAYKELLQTLTLQRTLFLETVAQLKEAKNDKWMSVSEVLEYTGFSRQWLMARKNDIGFFQDGKDLRFLKSNVIKFMSLRSVEPKINKTLLKLKSA